MIKKHELGVNGFKIIIITLKLRIIMIVETHLSGFIIKCLILEILCTYLIIVGPFVVILFIYFHMEIITLQNLTCTIDFFIIITIICFIYSVIFPPG